MSLPVVDPASKPRKDYYPWIAVLLLWCICFFNYADRLAIFSVFPVLEKEFGFTKTQLGMIGAAFTWVYASASPIAGVIGDRFSRKGVILGGLAIWSAITGLTGACNTYWQFLLVRGSEGLGEAFYFPASMAYIADHHGPRTRSRATSVHQTSLYIGTIFGGGLAGWMAMHYGWRAPFVILGIAGIVLAIVLKFVMREARTERKPSTRPPLVDYLAFLKHLRTNKTACLIIGAFFGANMVNAVFLTWMPTFLKEKFALNLTMAGLGATLFIQIACFAGALTGGQVADFWAMKTPDGRLRLKVLATFIGAPFIWICGTTLNPLWLIVSMIVFGFCKGLYDANLTPAYYDVVPERWRSSATGLMNLIGFIGAGLGSVAIGVAVDAGISMGTAIGTVGIVYVFVAVTLLLTLGKGAQHDITQASQEH